MIFVKKRKRNTLIHLVGLYPEGGGGDPKSGVISLLATERVIFRVGVGGAYHGGALTRDVTVLWLRYNRNVMFNDLKMG